ncbi:MAG: glycosyltransferase family 2 protein [Gammaproteobacteria bacterium]
MNGGSHSLTDKPRISRQSVDVSVIIPSYRDWNLLPHCLESLAKQQTDIVFETIVVASGEVGGAPPLMMEHFPWVRFVLVPERKFPGAARSFGAGEARGDILLFIDADCTLAPDGLQQVVESHSRHAAPLIGGTIAQSEIANAVAWGYYFSSFSAWIPRRSDMPVRVADLATPCYSMKRWAFELYGPFPALRYCEDTLLSWRIRSAGFEILLDPTIRVQHNGIDSLLFLLRRKFRHGKAFAQMRANARRWSFLRQLLQIIGEPLVPLVLIYRIGRNTFRVDRYRMHFFQSLPFTFAAVLAWSIGEWVGYWRPPQLATSDTN